MAQSKKGMLADLFDGTFRALPRTWATSIVCGGILFLPSALLYGWSFGRIMGLMSDLVQADSSNVLPAVGLAWLWIFLAVLLQGFAMLFVRACVTEQTLRVTRGETVRLPQILGTVFLHRYGKLIGQRALQYAILGVAVAAGFFVAGALFGVARLVPVAAVGGVVIGLGAWGVAIWFSIRWSLTLEAVVIEDVGVERSLDRSSQLVHGAWWRVLGYTLLLSLMMSFAVSLVATPLVFFATIRTYAQFLSGMLAGNESVEDLPALIRSLFAGMGPRLAFLTYLQSLFAVLVIPVFMTLLFLGLRSRTDEPALVEQIPPAASPQDSLPPEGPAQVP